MFTSAAMPAVVPGLAIYNSHILEFQFPMVLYKKLMGQQIGLADLAELHPDVHASLTKLLDMSGEQLEALNLAFQVRSRGFWGLEFMGYNLRFRV